MTDTRHKDGTITRNGVRFGCHCDTANDTEIDFCVIDNDDHWSCTYATLKGGRLRRSQWTCKDWRAMPAAEAKRRGDQ